jgi:uncharacterized protein YcfL
MRHFILIISVIFIFGACSAKKAVVKIEDQSSTGDSVQYELIIDEQGFDSWVATNSKPIWYHEKEYYRTWNILYLTEFNYRVLQTNSDHPFTETINYDLQTDYGLDLEYKLYWYFKFIEYKYNTKLHISSR